ncbi:MAG: flagellar hook-associated protein FlgL [Thermodesulfobacteriota bacterium]
MRVTNKMILSTLFNDISKTNTRLFKSYAQLASGKKVNTPSDDPLAVNGILQHKRIISDTEQYQRNIEHAKGYLATSESVMSELTNNLSRLRELAVSQGSGTANAETRLDISFEVGELFNQLVSAGNSKFGDRYLFAGHLSDTPPFDSVGAYGGDSSESALQIGPSTTFTYGTTGNKLFKGVGFTGGVDIYQVVDDFKTALVGNNTTNIQNAIGNLDSALNQVDKVTAQIGARINRVDAQKTSLDNFLLEATQLLSNAEETDFTSVTTELALQQTTLEALLASSSKVNTLNIFNFIR